LITPEIIEELQTCQERSGIGPVALLSRKPGKPKGLNAGLIYNWLSGKAKTARKDYFDYVLTQWKQAAQHVRQIWHEGESQEFDLELFLKHRGKTPTGNPEASVSLPETLPKPKRPTDKRGYLLDELANNIRKIREKRGISKEALAQACGVTPGTINSWETKKGPFQLQTATCVAQALGSPIEELFPAGVTQGRMKKMPDVSPLHPHRTREELKKLLEQHTTDAPNNIRLIRTACGMGLKDLAERLGTSTSTVYHLEVGKIDTSPQWCLRLGEVFECPPACFKNKAEQGLRSPG
jgi:DNA-binding XRE family transcriptional regulator